MVTSCAARLAIASPPAQLSAQPAPRSRTRTFTRAIGGGNRDDRRQSKPPARARSALAPPGRLMKSSRPGPHLVDLAKGFLEVARHIKTSASADGRASVTTVVPPLEIRFPKEYHPSWEKPLGNFVDSFLPWATPLSTIVAVLYPPSFLWFTPNMFGHGMALMMFAAAVKLHFYDFAQVLKRPGIVGLGMAINWITKPLLAVFLATVLPLPDAIATGLIMVGCVQPSPLSTKASGIAKGSMALAVTLVSFSTFAAMFITPLLLKLFIGGHVTVPAAMMAKTIFEVIVAPTLAGILLNEYAEPVANLIKPCAPLLGVVGIMLVLGGATALHYQKILTVTGALVFLPILLYHCAAYGAAQLACNAADLAKEDSRPIVIVTGMQASTLATVLCTKFIADQTAMIPTVLSTIVMANTGLILASHWKRWCPPASAIFPK